MLLAAKHMLHTVKQRVGYLLEELPETRDSDKKLLWVYWQHFDGAPDLMDFETFKKLTPPESITRARRERQEHGDYLATEKVKEVRAVKEQVYSGEFGNHPGMFWK